jgi:hypothetical protein
MEGGIESPRRTVRRALVLAASLAAAAGILAGSAAGTGRYTDPAGDSGAAPDVTGATVSSMADGQIVFRIGITNLPSSGEVRTVVLVDSDANPDTGKLESVGAEYFFVVSQADRSYGFARWTGSAWDWDTPYSSVRVSTGSDGVTISVNKSELGGTAQLNFWARTLTAEGGEGNQDTAPDSGLWNYDLAAGGPDIQGVTITTAPKFGPKAGKRFTVEVAGLKLPPDGAAVSILPHPESTACTATLAGRRLAGTGCSWKVPKRTRGKTIVVSVTVSYQGASKTIPFSFKVS